MAVIKLIGPGTIAEGNFAIFAVALDEQLSPSLAAGAFIDISLDSAPGSATEATDFARLVATDLLAADSSKLRLSNFSTNSSTGAVSFRVTNIGTTSLPPGTSLLSFALATREDTAVEPDENYSVSLAATSAGDSVAAGAAVVTTTIGTIRPRVLNWGASVGNRTIDTTGSFLVPELDFERFARGVGAGSLVAGGRYQIFETGSTDWTTVGAPDSNPGTIFTATGSGGGTGTAGQFLPNNLVGKNDYGLGFNFTVDATSGDGTFVLDDNGLKIPSGYVVYEPSSPTVQTNAGQFEIGGRYTISAAGTTDFTLIGAPNNNIGTVFTATGRGSGTGTATSDGADYLYAIGYPLGVLTSGEYINALDTSTLRLGNGNDYFSVIGKGITQKVRENVSIDSSFGYIFQSSIFAGSGDDTLRVLMPWQSTFKGGTNTVYYDAVFGTNPGNGIGVTLSNTVVLEEIPYGDLIELKGSRFDWDIEFKDGDGDSIVTLESILDERDYLAVANNNQISGFERIQFGDILFDLVLYRQQQSSVVYGQPEYYLNGLESLAPELNSDISSGSKLWEAFRFNRTKLQGITGTATDQTDVFTGDTNDTPFIVGALRFAALNTEEGNDIVEIGTAGETAVDQASIDLGSGTDQLKVNGLFTRSSAAGGDGADNIILTTVSNATVDGGTGDDVVEITTSVSQTAFTGGTGSDVLLLNGTYASYLLTSSVTADVITFSDGFGNSISGFETIKFSDINLDALQQLSLTGTAAVNEGGTALYTVDLNGGAGLLTGESVAFSLQLSGSGSNPTNVFTDLAALVAVSLQASAGIVLTNLSVDASTGLIRAVATAANPLAAGSSIATLSVPVNADLLLENAETFQVTLRDFGALVPATQQVTTTISNVPPLTIRLTGPSAAVTEGSDASYTVSLASTGLQLAVGRSVTFTLDSASGTATEGTDFNALIAGVLEANSAAGITLTTSEGANGAITVTATNNGTTELAAGDPLLTFAIPTTLDSLAESSESFAVTLSSSSALVSAGAGVVNTTITDQVPSIRIRLDPSPTTAVMEGGAAAFLVSLDGTELKAGERVRLRLDTATSTAPGISPAREGVDFAALIASAIKPESGVSLSSISTSSNGAITLTATNIGGFDLPDDALLLSFSVNTTNDAFAEGPEDFTVTLSSFSPASVTDNAQSATVTINDNDTPAIRLTGASSVTEGSSASYVVALDGVGLGAGRSVTFTLDSASGTAREATDFSALVVSSVGAGLTAASGITLSNISTNTATGAVTLTATNSSGADLAINSELLSFSLTTTPDTLPELNETFSVSLTGSTGGNAVSVAAGAGLITSAITDDDVVSLALTTVDATVGEGITADYAVVLSGSGLGVGRSVSFSLDSQGLADSTDLSAREGTDFAALLAAALRLPAGSGLTLTTATGSNGVLNVTVTNNGTNDRVDGDQLLSFSLATTNDQVSEGAETFAVSLASASATVSTGLVTTAIADNDPAAIKLTGASSAAEGSSASYAVILDGVGLGAGRSVTFSLDTASGTGATGALEASDFAALVAGNLTAASGISLGNVIPGADGVFTITATNSSGSDLAAGTQLLSFSIAATNDLFSEADETFSVSLSGSTGSTPVTVAAGAGLVTTSITDNDPAAIKLTGASSVTEGSSASYAVALDGVGLGAGRSVSFTLDSAGSPGAGLTATEGTDFAALVAGSLTAASGQLALSTTTGANGALNVTVTNNGADLAANSQLLSFSLAATDDFLSEGDESFTVSLSGSTGTNPATVAAGAGLVTTTIAASDPAAIRLSGSGSVAEGATASYAVELDGVGLGAGRSIAISLFTSKTGTATESSDFARFLASALNAADGISLTGISTDTAGTVSATVTSTKDLAVGAPLLTFSLATLADAVSELAETFELNLSSAGLQGAAVRIATLQTTITDTTAPVIRLTGPAAVTEGSPAVYGVALDGVALGGGRSVSFTLDSQGFGDLADLSATQGKDLAALVAANLKATPLGLTLSAISTDSSTGAITLTATNTLATDLAAGSQLVSFELPTSNDVLVEGDETFRVSLASTTASVTGAVISTTISDDDAPVLKLTGSDTVAEAATATYAVSLDGVGLGAGRSVTFTLDSASGTATEGTDKDFGALVASSLTAASGQLGLSTNPPSASGAVSVTITNNGADLAAGSKLLDIALPTTGDLLVEGNEAFALTLSSTTATVTGGGSAATVNTTITDDDIPLISLSGPASVSEGASGSYTVALSGIGLGAGRSLSFSLDTASGSGASAATEGTDFAALVASSLTPAGGISLSGVSTAADGTVNLTVTNSSGGDLGSGTALLSFTIATTQDALTEASESFSVSFGGSNGAATLTTSISDNDPAALRLTGATSVLEGASASYAVALDGVGLGAGRSVTFTLDSASGTGSAGATEVTDFAALVAGSLTAATGVTLSGLSSGANGAITLTATNTGGKDLDVGAQLLSFAIATSTDAGAETDESFEVSLSSSGASVASGAGLVTTTIENIGGLISRITTRGSGSLSPAQWLELNGDTPDAPPFTGLTGSEDATITVNTGDTANSVRLSDAIAFATLNTGDGNDQVLVAFPPSRDLPYVQFGHGAYKATINTGAGNDVINIQSADNSAYVRSTPQDPPSYNLPDYYDSVIDAGSGDDYVYGFLPYKTQFIGNTGTDTLFLYGRYSDWSVQTVDVAADGLNLADGSSDYTLWSAATSLSNTAIDNAVRGFEFIQFNDITLDLVEQLTLSASAATVAEGSSASYAISLAGNGLAAGQSVAISLRLSGSTASLSSDLAAITASSLQAATGIVLQNVVVDPATGLIQAIASATKTFAAGASIASLVLPTTADLFVEGAETVSVALGGFSQLQTLTTTISDDDAAAIKLTGAGAVTEGSSASYAVALDGVGLGAGRQLTFTLDSASGTGAGGATEATDFAALVAGSLATASSSLALSSTAGANGALIVTVTNNGTDLAANSQLLSFSLAATNDLFSEADETFSVSLSGSTGSTPVTVAAGAGLVTTSITDNDPAAIKLTGASSVTEGGSASYAVALDGVGLGAGRSVSFTLDSAGSPGAGLTATEGTDFAALVAGSLTAASGQLALSTTTGANGALNVTVTNNGADFAANSQLLSFSLATTDDLFSEADESFSVSLSGSTGTNPATVAAGAGLVTTTITDNDTPAIRLTGSSAVAEGAAATYAVALDGVGLGAGRSLTFTLDSASGSGAAGATEATDFAALVAGSLAAASSSLALSSTAGANGALIVTLQNNGADLASGSTLLSFSLATTSDLFSEADESFSVTLAGSTGTSPTTVAAGADLIITSITDNDPAAIRLTGSSATAEGTAASYTVVLDGVGLGSGRSVSFTLDSASGTGFGGATEATDFAALVAGSLSAATGITLSGISTNATSGTVTLTATNNGGSDLAAGSQLLSFSLNTTNDLVSEPDESFSISLSNSSATLPGGLLSQALITSITDNDIAAIRLSGDTSVAEGDPSAQGIAKYAVSLDGVGLGIGRSVTFTLDTASATALKGVDFLAISSLVAPALSGISFTTSTAADGAITVTATNNGSTDLAVGAKLLDFIVTTTDNAAETTETYAVSLSSSTATIAAGLGSITTTIIDDDTAAIKLTAKSSSVAEGAIASYVIALDGVGLGVGRSLSLRIDTASGSGANAAIEGTDFAALIAASLTPAAGISLSGISTAVDGTVSLTATNTSGFDLPDDAQLISFDINISNDIVAEGDENFTVTLSNSTASLPGGASFQSISTTISDKNTSVSVGSGSFNANPSAQALAGTIKAVDLQTQQALPIETPPTVTSLAQLTAASPLTSTATAFLDRFTIVDPGSGATRKASASDTGLLDFTIKTGGLTTTIFDVQLATEVNANAYVKVSPTTGAVFDFTYDPITGLGAELLDTNVNGLVDTLRMHLRDGGLGDDDGLVNGEIRDPGLLAQAPRNPVYRFFRDGVHFYTTDVAERDSVISQSYGSGVKFSDLSNNPKARDPITGGLGYQYEGVAYQALETQGTALYRFFSPGKGYHFVTTDATEALNVIKKSVGSDYDLSNAKGQKLLSNGWGYQYEGTSYKVSTIAQTGMDTPVYRFYNQKKGVHFYSSSMEETKSVIANSLGSQYATDRWITSTSNALRSGFDSTPAPLANGWGYEFEGIAWYAAS